MIKQLALGTGMALLIGGAALASGQTSVAPAEQTASVTPAKPKKICRKEVEVGTIMPSRTCHTKEEWAAIDGRNQSNTDYTRDLRGGNGGSIPPS